MSRLAMALGAALMASPALADELPLEVQPLDRYAALTRIAPDCTSRRRADEITVCGRRDADRWRVPLIERDAGDPRAESVMGERTRLQRITTPCQDHGPFLIKCGMAGVSATIGFGGGGPQFRELAP